MAELVDEGQERGEIADKGRPVSVAASDTSAPATLADLGITRQRLHEARKLADVDKGQSVGSRAA